MSYGPYTPGDFFVVRTGGTIASLIRYFTRSRYNHAGVIIDQSGLTVEAQPRGACLGHMDAYDNDLILIGNPAHPTDEQRNEISRLALKTLGTPYGFLDIVSIGLLQYHIKPRFIRRRVQRSDHLICSQLVDYVCSEAGVHLFDDHRLPMDVTPGDLAKLFEK